MLVQSLVYSQSEPSLEDSHSSFWTNFYLFPARVWLRTPLGKVRRGKREAELEQQVQQLQAVFDAMRRSEEIRLEVENMSDEEIAKELAGNGEFRD